MKHIGVAAFFACFGCSASPPFCGESFCMIEKPNGVAKSSPSDFNIYHIDYGGRHFLIYEGNHPQGGDDLGSIGADLVPPGFAEGELFKTAEQFSLVLRTPSPRFPEYIAVSVDSNDPSDLQHLASKLRAKQVCRDCP